MNTFSEYTFAYQKTLLHTLLLLIFEIVESLQCILKLGKTLHTFLDFLTEKNFKALIKSMKLIINFIIVFFNQLQT